MKRILGMAGAALLALTVAAGILAWQEMGKPLYTPGMVREGKALRASLTPPRQTDGAGTWTVEPDIILKRFTVGKGRRVLIVHGGPGMPYTRPWTGLESLTDAYQFHYYDQRGSGQSSRPIDRFPSRNFRENIRLLDQTLGLQAQIADIERIRRILGEEKLILIGHSFGGFLVSLYAAEFPERVEAMILVAPADVLVMPNERGGLFPLVRERLPETERPAFDEWMRGYFDYGRIFTKSEAELVATNEAFGKFYGMVTRQAMPPQGGTGGWMPHALYFSMGQRHDFRPALRRVTAPVLVIHGGKDLQPEQASHDYAEAFPNAGYEVIPEAGHVPFDTHPEEFAEVVAAFLKRRK